MLLTTNENVQVQGHILMKVWQGFNSSFRPIRKGCTHLQGNKLNMLFFIAEGRSEEVRNLVNDFILAWQCVKNKLLTHRKSLDSRLIIPEL